MNRIRLTMLAACITACGSSMPLEEQADDAQLEQPSSDEGVLHEVSLPGDVTVQVLGERLGSPSEQILISVEGPIGFPDPITALRAAEGRLLTQLELFLGVAPPGTEPHPALYRAHETEAAAMRRARPQEVVNAALPADWAHSEKDFTPETCRVAVFPSLFEDALGFWATPHVQSFDIQSPSRLLHCVGGEASEFPSPRDPITLLACRRPFQLTTRVGLCNDHPTESAVLQRAIASNRFAIAELSQSFEVLPGRSRALATGFKATPFFEAALVTPPRFNTARGFLTTSRIVDIFRRVREPEPEPTPVEIAIDIAREILDRLPSGGGRP